MCVVYPELPKDHKNTLLQQKELQVVRVCDTVPLVCVMTSRKHLAM